MRIIHNPDNLPVIPPLPEPTNPYDIGKLPRPPADGAVAICGECCRRIGRVEGYCCQNPRCPVYPRAIS